MTNTGNCGHQTATLRVTGVRILKEVPGCHQGGPQNRGTRAFGGYATPARAWGRRRTELAISVHCFRNGD